MKALLYNRHINNKSFAPIFIMAPSFYITSVLYPSTVFNQRVLMI